MYPSHTVRLLHLAYRVHSPKNRTHVLSLSLSLLKICTHAHASERKTSYARSLVAHIAGYRGAGIKKWHARSLSIPVVWHSSERRASSRAPSVVATGSLFLSLFISYAEKKEGSFFYGDRTVCMCILSHMYTEEEEEETVVVV